MTSLLIIQILLILAVLVLAIYFVTHRNSAGVKAWAKIAFVLFMLAAVWAVLRPNDLTFLARKLGVARGTDLLLYATVILLFFSIIFGYLRSREQEVRFAKLARAVALKNPIVPGDDLPGELKVREESAQEHSDRLEGPVE